MKKFLFLFSVLSILTITQVQAQSSICEKICPVNCCVLTGDAEKTATADVTNIEVQAVAVAQKNTAKAENCTIASTQNCSPAMQKICKVLGLSCETSNTVTTTKLATKTPSNCCKAAANTKASCQKVALLEESL